MRQFLRPSIRHFSKANKTLNEKQALIEIIEDSPYKFMNYQEPSNFKELKKFNNKAFNKTFRAVYQQFLQVYASGDLEILKQMCEPQLFSEIQEFCTDLIDLNEARLIVENEDTSNFEIYANEITFVAGKHVDETRNQKELIGQYNDEYRGNYTQKPPKKNPRKPGSIELEFHLSKHPLKFTQIPFNLVLDFHFLSPLKLNLKRYNAQLIERKEDLLRPEFHHLRFEGLIETFSTSIQDIVQIRDQYMFLGRKIAEEDYLPDVQEWTITDLDQRNK